MFSAVQQALERRTIFQRVREAFTNLEVSRPRFSPTAAPIACALLCCYLMAVGIHYALLKPVTVAPYIAYDGVQYALIGENIRAGNGFTSRGVFHTTAPPLTPLFVAWTHGLLDDPRQGFFIVSVLVICSMLFPLYLTGRRIGLGRWPSLAVAAAGTFIPQTFYAGMYMSETLHLPLFSWALWLMLVWLDKPRTAVSAGLGLVFALMALNRVAAITPVVCFYAVVTTWLVRARLGRSERPFGYLTAAIPALLYVGAQASWFWYKASVGADLLGLYGAGRRANLLTLELLTAYVTDALLAPAIITGGCFFMGLHEIRKDNWRQALLMLLLPVVLVLGTAFSDGSLTGYLRERYFIYASPLMMAVAVRGVRALLTLEPRWVGRMIFLTVPLSCLFGLLLYGFPVPALVESSWAHAMGTTGAQFSKEALLVRGLAVLGISGLFLVRFRQQSQALLALYLVAFQLFAFSRVATDISAATTVISERTAVFTSLFPQDSKPLQRVFIGGVPSEWEQRAIPVNDRFVAYHRNQGLTDYFVWYLETMRLFDVRMCGSPHCVLEPDARGAFFLTTLEFPTLDLVNKRRGYYLYRIPERAAKPVAPDPMRIPAARLFTTGLTERMLHGEIAGRGDGREGLLVRGPYVSLQPGVYAVQLDFTASPQAHYKLDVMADGRSLAALSGESRKFQPIEFALTRQASLDIRLIGPNRSDLVVRGAVLKHRVEGEWAFAQPRYVQEIDSSRFGTQYGSRAPDGTLVGSAVDQTGYFCFGPYEKLPAGVYEIEFLLTGDSPYAVVGDVYAAPDTLATGTFAANGPKRLRFSADGQKQIEFRLQTRNHRSLEFRGVRVALVEDPPEAGTTPPATQAK